jgi:signal peptidase II
VPPKNLTLFIVLAGGGAVLDLASKSLVFKSVGIPQDGLPNPKQLIWPGVLSLTTSFNPGALWGLGGSVPFANVLFACLSVLAGAAIVYWLFWHGAARDRLLTAALGLIMAGTIGNCYDRLVWKKVRDWIYFELINWPIFNLADSMLVCGACVLLLQAVFAESAHAKPATSASSITEPAVEIGKE